MQCRSSATIDLEPRSRLEAIPGPPGVSSSGGMVYRKGREGTVPSAERVPGGRPSKSPLQTNDHIRWVRRQRGVQVGEATDVQPLDRIL